jgi:hypothetical protein
MLRDAYYEVQESRMVAERNVAPRAQIPSGNSMLIVEYVAAGSIKAGLRKLGGYKVVHRISPPPNRTFSETISACDPC